MTPGEYAKKLDRILKNLETNNTPFKKAVQTTHVQRITRIFDRGEKADGGAIGQYSTKPIYINPQKVGFNFKPQGKRVGARSAEVQSIKTRNIKLIITKRGKFAGRQVADRKTRYFPFGYKQFRSLVKRPVNFINLGLKYDLRFDLSNSKNKKVNMPEKKSAHEYIERLKRPKNVEKADGLSDRFGNIFGFQQKERTDFNRILQVELTNLLK